MRSVGKVSVIMPAYNAAEFLEQSVFSVLSQSYKDWELIIVDDHSTDATLKIANKAAQTDERIRILQNTKNEGAAISRNKAIKAASGRFMAFLDADDLWKPEKLEIQLQKMKDEDLAACFSSYEYVDKKSNKLGKGIRALPVLDFQKLEKANYVGNLTGMYDAEKLGKIYCPDLLKRQDWGLWLLVIRAAGSMKGIQRPLAYYRLGNHSISSNKLEMLRYNYLVYRKVLEYDGIKSVFKMLRFLYEQFFVKSRQNFRTV